MRRNAVFLILTFVGLAAFAAFAVWAFYVTQKIDGGWASLAPIWGVILAGLVVVGGLAGGLMWLAFYSANHGYDDRKDL